MNDISLPEVSEVDLDSLKDVLNDEIAGLMLL